MIEIYTTEPVSEFKIRCKKIVHPFVFIGLKSQQNGQMIAFKERKVKELKKKCSRSLDIILSMVTQEFSTSYSEMGEDTNQKHIVEPRHAFYYLLREYTDMSYKSIGNSLGKRQDHTTVIHACRKCEQSIKIKDEFGLRLIEIENALTT
jgi:chromosomal replication initiation ATPase DnaA